MADKVVVVLDRGQARALAQHGTSREDVWTDHDYARLAEGQDALRAALDRGPNEMETRIAKALWKDATGQGNERTDELFHVVTDPVLRTHADRCLASAQAVIATIGGEQDE